jgi:uncharacterized protein YbjT (DUF2867 family)
MAKTVLVSGASGFVDALIAAGYEVRAMTRHLDSYHGAGAPVAGDITDTASLEAAPDGVDYAYYLVHSLGSPGYAETDARGARRVRGRLRRPRRGPPHLPGRPGRGVTVVGAPALAPGGGAAAHAGHRLSGDVALTLAAHRRKDTARGAPLQAEQEAPDC